MGKAIQKTQNSMLFQLFLKLLPVQTGLVAMGAANQIIDGIIAGRFIDPETVGVVGLYYTMLRVMEAVSSLLLAGATVMCGRYLGAGKVEKTRGISSLCMFAAFAVGAFLTAVSLIAPGTVAVILGADAQLLPSLSTYVRGYAFGILPQLLGQQLALCLQLERQDKRGEVGIAALIVSNALLDVLFVAVMDMGVWGLALATSVSYIVYFLIVGSYYLRRDAQLKPDLKLISWKEFPGVVKYGAPGALLVACLCARSLVINHLMINFSGPDGLSALSAFNMSSGLILSFSLGAGAVVRILSSVFLGEDNREGVLDLLKLVCTRILAVTLVLAIMISLLSPVLSGIFFPDKTSEVYALARQLFFIYGFTVPFSYICIIYSSYAQAAGLMKFVHMISVCDGFLSMVIPAVLLTPVLGAMGMWLSFPIGLLITNIVTLIYIVVRNGHWPRNMSEWFLLNPELGQKPHLVMPISKKDEITGIEGRVEDFCRESGLSHRLAMHVGLCMEELALNILQHGFQADRKKHQIEIRVVEEEQAVTLRIKDDCIAFNPKEWYEVTNPTDPTANIGTRIIFNLADDLNYQNLLGMNVVTVRVNANTQL